MWRWRSLSGSFSKIKLVESRFVRVAAMRECGCSLMSPKKHGTSHAPVQENLLYGCDQEVADRICNFNRHYAEFSDYFLKTNWLQEVQHKENATTYYDSNSGQLLFIAPQNRS